MRAAQFVLQLAYARGLLDSGDSFINDMCMLQLHKINALIGPEAPVTEKESTQGNARGSEREAGIRDPTLNDDIGHSPVQEMHSEGKEESISHAGLTKTVGEVALGLTSVSTSSATDSFNSAKCQRFYLDPVPRGYPWGVGAHDDTTSMFRPATEIAPTMPVSGTVKTWPVVEFKRLVTYEDVATPVDYHGLTTYPKRNHCMHYAVRTPQRPVKTMAGTARNGRTFAMPSVWKSGSTSFNKMFERSTSDFHPEHSHNERSPSCEGPFELQQCEKHSSFDSSGVEVMFAAVRNPLDRFISSIQEHHDFRICGGQACEEDVQLGKDTAARLLAEFPYLWNSCEHATQSYLLSGTDINGNPMSFQQIFRLESLEDGLHAMESMFDQTFEMGHHNRKDVEAKQLLYNAVFEDLTTLCSICKIYAQDFECFGYSMPESCTEEKCVSVGISLKSESLLGEA